MQLRSGAAKQSAELPHDPAIPLLRIYIYMSNKNSNLKRDMHSDVHSSMIYNSQDMEAT